MQLGMYKNKIYIKYNEANVVNSVDATSSQEQRKRREKDAIIVHASQAF